MAIPEGKKKQKNKRGVAERNNTGSHLNEGIYLKTLKAKALGINGLKATAAALIAQIHTG